MATVTCLETEQPEGRRSHLWERRGLDINARGALVNVRRCVWCHVEQSKRYGAKGGWS